MRFRLHENPGRRVELCEEIWRLRAALHTLATWYMDCPSDAEQMAKFAERALMGQTASKDEEKLGIGGVVSYPGVSVD